MDQAPANALKHGKDSSLWICLDEVKNGESYGAVSAEHRSADGFSRHIVKTISGISRPAVAFHSQMLVRNNCTRPWANISCDADQCCNLQLWVRLFRQRWKT